jgi:hypothetical protein
MPVILICDHDLFLLVVQIRLPLQMQGLEMRRGILSSASCVRVNSAAKIKEGGLI